MPCPAHQVSAALQGIPEDVCRKFQLGKCHRSNPDPDPNPNPDPDPNLNPNPNPNPDPDPGPYLTEP